MAVLILQGLILGLVLVFPLLIQPLSLGLAIMGVAVCLSAMIGVVSSWYGFILFLVYVGGLLVMFGYVLALMPNMWFSGRSVLLVLFFSVLVTLVTGGLGSVRSSADFFFDSAELLYSDLGFFVVVGLGFILFLALLVVVKICYFHGGPLRPF